MHPDHLYRQRKSTASSSPSNGSIGAGSDSPSSEPFATAHGAPLQPIPFPTAHSSSASALHQKIAPKPRKRPQDRFGDAVNSPSHDRRNRTELLHRATRRFAWLRAI